MYKTHILIYLKHISTDRHGVIIILIDPPLLISYNLYENVRSHFVSVWHAVSAE